MSKNISLEDFRLFKLSYCGHVAIFKNPTHCIGLIKCNKDEFLKIHSMTNGLLHVYVDDLKFADVNKIYCMSVIDFASKVTKISVKK